MNVYYLPARDTEMAAASTSGSRWSVLRARSHRAWWRLRLTAIDVWAALRRGGARPPVDENIWLAAPEPAPRRRAPGPARIIDLELARRRRALAAARA